MVAVGVDNFVRAETARMFDGVMAQVGAVNRWIHNRVPTPLDAQNVIRMNRDTLYSSALVDISEGAILTMPDSAGRYMSMMVINEDHYINDIFHEPGTYELSVGDFDTPYVGLVLRTFVDPQDADDLAVVHALQDGLGLEAESATPYSHPAYDEDGRKETAEALLMLAKGVPDSRGTFGAKAEVNPIRHLIGTVAGWGGLPESEAYYIIETEPRPVGHYTLTVSDVPVDGFWSLSIYNRDGFFEENPYDTYSLNNLTSETNDDGSFTLNLAPDGEGLTNYLYVMEGWNYAFRCYRPRQAILDGTWTLPEPQLQK